MNVVGAFFFNRAVIDFLVLLLEELPKSRTVVTPITLGPKTDPVIMRFVCRELGEPSLGKVLQSMSSMQRSISRCIQ